VKKVDDESIQLFRRNPKLCVPSHFDYSPYFEIIKYPFIDFSLHSDHRLLPWQGSGTLSGDESMMYHTDPINIDEDFNENPENRIKPQPEQTNESEKPEEKNIKGIGIKAPTSFKEALGIIEQISEKSDADKQQDNTPESGQTENQHSNSTEPGKIKTQIQNLNTRYKSLFNSKETEISESDTQAENDSESHPKNESDQSNKPLPPQSD